MTRLNVGIVGGGLIAQVEHLPNLLNLPRLFQVAGVVDPSPAVRAHIGARWSVPVFETAEALLALPLDGVVIATPDCYHADLAILALRRGLHVFCEKPLCYSPEEAEAVVAARDAADRIVQVGYMKRFDPSVRLLGELIAGRGERLRYLSVEVSDPGSWPFVAHHDYFEGKDVAPELIAEGKARRDEQIARVIGADASPETVTGYAQPFASSLVHDVNVGHFLLDALGLDTGAIAGAAFYAASAGGQAAVRLEPGGALWTLSHTAVPGLADYLERISLFFADRIFELSFPSPYLNHQPTRLIEKVSEGSHARTIEHRASYAEAFVEELTAWHRAIVDGERVRNTVEDARRDMALISRLGRVAAGAA